MNIGDVVFLIRGDGSMFKKDAEKAAGEAGDAAGKTFSSKIGAAYSKNAKVIGAAIGATFATGIKSAADFQDGLRTINTVAHLTDKELAGVGDSIQALSRETGKSTADLSSGFYDLVSAGIPADKAIKVLRDSAILATGALGTTGEAVDLVSSALNAYGLSADKSTRVTDIFAQAVADGKVTAAELGSTIATIAPIAASAGVSLEEVAAGYALMTAKGVPAAQAATQMRAAISALLTPNTQLAQISKQVGVNFADMAKEKGLAVTLNAIRTATHGDENAFAKALGSIEAYSFALGTTGDNAGAMATELGKIKGGADKGGVALDQYTEKSKSANEQAARLRATIATFLQDVGGPFVDSLGTWVQVLGEVPGAAQAAGAAIGAIATKAIPALASGLVGAFAKAGEQAAMAFVGAQAAGGFLGVLASAIAAAGIIVIPVTLAVAAVAITKDQSKEIGAQITQNLTTTLTKQGLLVKGLSDKAIGDLYLMASAWGETTKQMIEDGKTVNDALQSISFLDATADDIAAQRAAGVEAARGAKVFAEALANKAAAIKAYEAQTGGFIGRLAASLRPVSPQLVDAAANLRIFEAAWGHLGAHLMDIGIDVDRATDRLRELGFSDADIKAIYDGSYKAGAAATKGATDSIAEGGQATIAVLEETLRQQEIARDKAAAQAIVNEHRRQAQMRDEGIIAEMKVTAAAGLHAFIDGLAQTSPEALAAEQKYLDDITQRFNDAMGSLAGITRHTLHDAKIEAEAGLSDIAWALKHKLYEAKLESFYKSQIDAGMKQLLKAQKSGDALAIAEAQAFVDKYTGALKELQGAVLTMKTTVLFPSLRGGAAGYAAKGGTVRGWTWVGERGPELMHFDHPATVVPHDQSVAMARGGGDYTITIANPDGSLARSGIGTGQLGSAIGQLLTAAESAGGHRYSSPRR